MDNPEKLGTLSAQDEDNPEKLGTLSAQDEDNPEKLGTLSTQDTRRRQIIQHNMCRTPLYANKHK